MVEESDFYPFGQERTPIVDNLDNNYKYTQHERDAESGLDHTLYRQYASTTGRWLSPDSLHGNPVAPQSWNRYAYVLGNPTNNEDDNGQACTTTQQGGTFKVNCFEFLDLSSNPFYRAAGSIPMGLGMDPEILWSLNQVQTDIEMARQAALNEYARGLANDVKEGRTNQCQALASYADAAEENNTADFLSNAFDIFIGAGSFVSATSTGATQFPVKFESGANATGFKPEFENSDGDLSDQVHHFAGFFQLGFLYGATLGAMGASIYERLTAPSGRPANQGDVNLGKAAAAMGAGTAGFTLLTGGLGNAIRGTLCTE